MTCVDYIIYWNLGNVVFGCIGLIQSLIHGCFGCDICQNVGILVSGCWILSSGLTVFYFHMFENAVDQVKIWNVLQWLTFFLFQMGILFFFLFPLIVIKKKECEGFGVDVFYGYVGPVQCIALVSFWLFGCAQCGYRPHTLAIPQDDM